MINVQCKHIASRERKHVSQHSETQNDIDVSNENVLQTILKFVYTQYYNERRLLFQEKKKREKEENQFSLRRRIDKT